MRTCAPKGLTAVAALALACVLAPSAFTDSPETRRGQDVIKLASRSEAAKRASWRPVGLVETTRWPWSRTSKALRDTRDW